MNKKIILICCYMGKLPIYFSTWKKSIEYNKSVDWLLITDQPVSTELSNLKIINKSVKDIESLAKKMLMCEVVELTPYKLCDLKVAYGLIFKDYIKNYDFWGYCDMDVIFGDLAKYFTEAITEDFDRIYPLGHLSIYKNNEEINMRIFDNRAIITFKEALLMPNTVGFDENVGINEIYKNSNKFYNKIDFADISVRHERILVSKFYNTLFKNYKFQIFFWEDGKVFRVYASGSTLIKEEFVYVHFQKRKLSIINMENIHNCKQIFLLPHALIVEKEKIRIDKNLIKKLNPYKGIIFEYKEYLRYTSRCYLSSIERKIKKAYEQVRGR